MILDVYVAAENLHDVDALPGILRRLRKRMGHPPKYLGLDAGYHSAKVGHLLEQLGIQGVIGYRRHTHKGEHYGKYRFAYDPKTDTCRCPQKQPLTLRTVNRHGNKEYWSDSKVCSGCPRRKECFSEKAARRLIVRHLWQDTLDNNDAFTNSPTGKSYTTGARKPLSAPLLKARRIMGCEPPVCLVLPGQEQSFLTAAVQNMKRIARFCFSFFPLRRYMRKPGKITPILPGLSLV